MRAYSSATAAYFASRESFVGHILLWVSARNRSSGANERIGFWTGVDHQDFTIEGQTRTYYAAGAMLKADPIRRQTGIKVRTQRVTLSQVSAEVQQLIRGYDPRHAPVELHRALFHPLTEALIDEPHVLLRGYIDKVSVSTPEKGGAGNVSIEIATEARSLTKPLSRFRSDASLRARASGDGFRKYASLTETAEVLWGRD